MQEVVEVLEKVVVGWRLRWVRQRRLCDVWLDTVAKKNETFSIGQWRANTLNFGVHFVHFLAVRFCSDGVIWIQEVEVNQTSWRPPSHHHDIPLVQMRLWEALWSFAAVQPLCWVLLAVVHNPFIIVGRNTIEEYIAVVAQKKHRHEVCTSSWSTHFMMMIFFLPVHAAYICWVFSQIAWGDPELLDELRLTFEQTLQSLCADFWNDTFNRTRPSIRRCQLQMDVRDLLHIQGSILHFEIFETSIALQFRSRFPGRLRCWFYESSVLFMA